jgi:hypothetical protein
MDDNREVLAVYEDGDEYDYSGWEDANAARQAQRLVDEIQHERAIVDEAVAHGAIHIGKRLLAAKELVPKGEWLKWLAVNFRWDRGTAGILMRIAYFCGELEMTGATISTTALRLLAHGAVPDAIRSELIGEARAGRIRTPGDVLGYLRERTPDLVRQVQGSAKNHRRDVQIQALKEFGLEIDKLFRAAVNMRQAVAVDYGLPFKDATADALVNLQAIADRLLDAVPKRTDMSRAVQGGKSINSSSQYVGVSWVKRDSRWRAQINIKGKRILLGGYASEEEAARAYDAAARRYYGPDAQVNFPDEQERGR